MMLLGALFLFALGSELLIACFACQVHYSAARGIQQRRETFGLSMCSAVLLLLGRCCSAAPAAPWWQHDSAPFPLQVPADLAQHASPVWAAAASSPAASPAIFSIGC